MVPAFWEIPLPAFAVYYNYFVIVIKTRAGCFDSGGGGPYNSP
jgi:hypothetical protein